MDQLKPRRMSKDLTNLLVDNLKDRNRQDVGLIVAAIHRTDVPPHQPMLPNHQQHQSLHVQTQGQTSLHPSNIRRGSYSLRQDKLALLKIWEDVVPGIGQILKHAQGFLL